MRFGVRSWRIEGGRISCFASCSVSLGACLGYEGNDLLLQNRKIRKPSVSAGSPVSPRDPSQTASGYRARGPPNFCGPTPRVGALLRAVQLAVHDRVAPRRFLAAYEKLCRNQNGAWNDFLWYGETSWWARAGILWAPQGTHQERVSSGGIFPRFPFWMRPGRFPS